MAVQVWGNGTTARREPQTASPRNVAFKATSVRVRHQIVDYMAAFYSASARMSAVASQKQEIDAVLLTEFGGQGWLDPVVGNE